MGAQRRINKRIAVVITVFNEEQNIRDCIHSAELLTNNIVVIDTESTDNTVSLSKKLGAQVYSFKYNRYVEPTRNFAIGKAKADWIFIMDADERITPILADEIHETISSTDKTYFYITRKNIFAGKKWLEYGGWNNDRIIRLVNKKAFRNWPKTIHSTPEIHGSAGDIKAPLTHHFHPGLENMVSKTALYEDIESGMLHKAKRSAGVLIFFRKFLGELYRRMFKWSGYKDGSFGIIESIYQAYSKTITYLMLYEKTHKKSPTI